MHTALRKMGNSTGMIVPQPVLREAGLASGAQLDISVKDGALIVRPLTTPVRAGWAEAAAALTEPDAEAQAWQDFGNDGDADLTW